MNVRGGDVPGCEILEYRGGRDPEVAALILAIQRVDVGLDVPIEEQPELLDVGRAYRDGAFWVAVANGAIVGTIGMLRYGASGILKKLFVRRDYRGPDGPSHRLYDKAIGWAVARDLTALFLDTPSIATRSHAFYVRRGFRVVDRTALPNGYEFPDRDSLIFRLDLPGPEVRARQGQAVGGADEFRVSR
ncbi:hypothetical protein ACVWZA_000567 [Sphingomonas sp. UYAg733]